MKLNLLATTAAAALLASGGIWAQAQAPGPKQDEKAQLHEPKGAAKQNRVDEKQAGKERDQAKPAQQAQDAQQKGNAAQERLNAKKDEAPKADKAAEQPQPKQPNAAAENQKGEPRANERERRNTASEMNKAKGQDAKDKAQAGKDSRQNQPKAAEQQKAGDQKATQSKQQAEQSKSASQPNANSAASKTGNATNQPASSPTRNAAQKSPAPSQSANQQATSSTQAGSTNTASAKLSDTDRTKVFSTLKSDRQAANQRIDIQVNVGTRLPPRIHARPLPRTVVDVLPQYRGYEYVTVRDEIFIVRPGTREVVDVIREGGASSFASRSTSGSRSTVQLTEQQRVMLREEARRFTTSQVSSAGAQCLSLQPVPAALANENPDLRQFQMLAIGDDIVLVDPSSKKVVDVIH